MFVIIMIIILLICFIALIKFVRGAIYYGQGNMLGYLIKQGIVDEEYLENIENRIMLDEHPCRLYFICLTARKELE